MRGLWFLVLSAALLSTSPADAQPQIQNPSPSASYPYYYQPPVYCPPVVYVPYHRPTLIGEWLFGPIWVPFPEHPQCPVRPQ